jgi:hypothetical protein
MFKRLAYQTLIGGAVLSLALAFSAGPAAAGATKCDPKKEKCGADCSPGYYRNHVDTWCGIVCPSDGVTVIGPSTCEFLLGELFSTGRGSGVRKNAAADFINEVCFVTAAASPCTDD